MLDWPLVGLEPFTKGADWEMLMRMMRDICGFALQVWVG